MKFSLTGKFFFACVFEIYREEKNNNNYLIFVSNFTEYNSKIVVIDEVS